MLTAYIGLGSNLACEGRRPAQLLDLSIDRLETAGRVIERSSIYQTEPVGTPAELGGQPSFYNAVVALQTEVPPLELLDTLLGIERSFGRDRRETDVRNGPRTLDLDLLLYGGLTMRSELLTLPHPRLAERRFVLAPLAEIAPSLLHPVLLQTMQELLDKLPHVGENRPEAVRRV